MQFSQSTYVHLITHMQHIRKQLFLFSFPHAHPFIKKVDFVKCNACSITQTLQEKVEKRVYTRHTSTLCLSLTKRLVSAIASAIINKRSSKIEKKNSFYRLTLFYFFQAEVRIFIFQARE